jgi:ubiquinone/menaquinone biosynthesis C-methylase UbiE
VSSIIACGRIARMCRTGSVPFIGNWRSNLLREVRGHVLEVGAGSGPNLDRYPPDASIVATEFNEESIAQARSRSSDRIRLASADIEHLAFPDDTFDAAVATLVFCSVERPVVGLREVRRVLKPG